MFIFPFKFSDIQIPYAGLFRLNSPPKFDQSQRNIYKKLQDIQKDLINDPSTITERQYFQFIYCFLRDSNSQAHAKLFCKVLELLFNGIQLITKEVHKYPQTNHQLQFQIKSILFLCFFAIDSTQYKKKQKRDAVTKAIQNKNNQNIQFTNQLNDLQSRIFNLIRFSLQIILARAQYMSQDSQLYKYFIDCALELLNKPKIFRLCKDSIIYIIKNLVPLTQSYIQSYCKTIISSIFQQEQSIDTIAQFLTLAVRDGSSTTQHLAKQVLTQMVQQLPHRGTLSAQSSIYKNSRQILVKLCTLIPKTLNGMLANFIQFFDTQSHFLRNTVADIIVAMIQRVLHAEEGKQDNPRVKERYINLLIDRVYDKNALCRSHLLGLLDDLCNSNLVPVQFLPQFLRVATDRTKDTSSKVRKKALQLLLSVLKMYIMVFQEGKQKFKQKNQLQQQRQKIKVDADKLKADLIQIEGGMANTTQQQMFEELQQEGNRLKIRIKDKMQMIDKVELYLDMLQSVGEQMTCLFNLLGSKIQSDTIQSLLTLQFLYLKGLKQAQTGIKKGLMLIFSNQKKIKQVVIDCFHGLFIKNYQPIVIAKNMFKLFKQATLQQQLCLHQWLLSFLSGPQSHTLPPAFYRICWQHFSQNIENPTSQTYAAIRILRIICKLQPYRIDRIMLQSLLGLLKKYLDVRPDFVIVKQIGLILIAKKNCQDCVGLIRPFIMALIYLLTQRIQYPDSHWHRAAQQVVNTIFQITKFPQKYSQLLLNNSSANLMKLQQSDESVSQTPIARCIFLVGHIALRMIGQLQILENKIRQKKKQNKQVQSEIQQVLGGKQAQCQKKIQQLHNIQQQILDQGIFKKWLPLIKHIVMQIAQQTKGVSSQLQRATVLTMTKLMCINLKYCRQMMEILFKILSNTGVDSCIKNNIVISLGDLLHRFPNQVQPYNKQLYKNLLDNCPKVRRCTLMVITHLFLNDMIKLRGQFINVALLFEDPDLDIQSLASIFFREVSKKDPKYLINTLPQAIVKLSDLSGTSGLPIKQKSFQIFAKNTLQNLDKERSTDILVQKLIAKLKQKQINILEKRNSALSLVLISKVISDKGLRYMIYEFDNYRYSLFQQPIIQHFHTLVSQLKKRKKNDKGVFKGLIQQFQQKVQNYADQSLIHRRPKRQNKKKKQVRSKQTRQKRKGRINSDDDSSSQQDKSNPNKKLKKRKNKQQFIIEDDDQ